MIKSLSLESKFGVVSYKKDPKEIKEILNNLENYKNFTIRVKCKCGNLHNINNKNCGVCGLPTKLK